MRGEEEQAINIKSNNPHLAGGEQFEYLLFEKMHLPNLRKARFCNQNCEIHGNLGGQEPGTKKNYFTSRDPHHDIYTFCYWQIFWHSI